MDFTRKNGIPEDKEGRASYITEDYIGRLYDVSYDIKAPDFGVDLRKMSTMFNYTDLSKYLSNFLEDEL
jgi:glutamate dehydrogenase/leucine dehydrogenase